MKKSSNWKREYGMFEASKEEIAYFESYEGKEVTLEEIIASSKKKRQAPLEKQTPILRK